MPTVDELAVKLEGVDSRSKSNTHRIDKLEERQDNLDKLATSVASLANEQEHVKEDVSEIKTDVKALAEKPGRRWEAIVDKAVWAVLAAVIAFVLGHVGL